MLLIFRLFRGHNYSNFGLSFWHKIVVGTKTRYIIWLFSNSNVRPRLCDSHIYVALIFVDFKNSWKQILLLISLKTVDSYIMLEIWIKLKIKSPIQFTFPHHILRFKKSLSSLCIAYKIDTFVLYLKNSNINTIT